MRELLYASIETVTEEASDSDIIKRVLAGERNEFRHLVRRYQNQVYAMLMRQLADPAKARELSQETFLKAYTGLVNYRGDAAFSTWLISISLNVMKTYFSSKAYRNAQKDTTAEKLEFLGVDVLEDKYLQSEFVQNLKLHVQELDEKYREVIVLCAFEGKSYAAAGEVLGIAEGTVCSRLNTARRILRTKLFKGAEDE